MSKYIFVTGGVVSSLGKGVTAAAIGRLLIARGISIKMVKIDPYLNIDPGTMNPYQHGEVYVTDDGTETDLDLGHYERFTGIHTSRDSNFTAGSVYWNVLEKERHGEYLGATIQMIPHITDQIKANITALEDDETDVVICELGGTVGDIEGLTFLEAIRQIGLDRGRANTMYIHLTYVPYINAAGEVKTKPTQQSVAKLREIGIIPQALICRTEKPLDDGVVAKLSLFCNVDSDAVIEELDVEHSIYEIPTVLAEQELDDQIVDHLDLGGHGRRLDDWNEMIERIINPERKVRIGVVGKYSELQDAYKSIYEALDHGGVAHHAAVEIVKLAAEEMEGEADISELMEGVDGLLIPGGFGVRGTDGKVKAIRHAREQGLPYFGICLGLQCAAIEFARNVCGLADANSTEIAPDNPHPVVCLMEEQEEVVDLGGTMRLGAWPCELKDGSRAAQSYGRRAISERHRHRYEFNNKYREIFGEKGMMLAGLSPDGKLVETIELPDHPWFVGVQFHPEFKSTPISPHPLFRDFIGAGLEYARAAAKGDR